MYNENMKFLQYALLVVSGCVYSFHSRF